MICAIKMTILSITIMLLRVFSRSRLLVRDSYSENIQQYSDLTDENHQTIQHELLQTVLLMSE